MARGAERSPPKPHGAGSAAGSAGPSQFSPGTYAKVMVPITMTACLAYFGAPMPLPTIPFWILTTRIIHSQKGESKLTYGVKIVVLNAVWQSITVCSTYLILKATLNAPLTSYHCISPYMVALTLQMQTTRHGAPYPWYFTPILRYWFDLPLVTVGYILREVFGIRLFCPFASVIDDEIVQGSMPFPSDVATMANEYNVGAVVNMCREWPGPTAQYAAHGIVQLHLPHQDTTSPFYDPLMAGCKFMKDFLADPKNKGKRVYVHCKGGIARASTMTLSHYIVNRGKEAGAAVEMMVEKRPVVMRKVAKYPVILRIVAEQEAEVAK
mmetsp:Transcript_61139/g.167571  ORF Transcript_61139/g.167571 Transcript_61139/m.167571 type:complete len:324 (+) Transcript_61139:106-1077(+)